MKRMHRFAPSPAMVVACLALLVALGGAGYAATALPRNSVGTPQLKRNAVTSIKVKDRSLLARDFRRGQLPRGARGLRGLTGAPGAAGAKGDKGDPGPSTGPAGGDLTGNYPNPTIASGAVSPTKFGVIPAVRARNAANQSIANSTVTSLTLATEDFDTQNLHDDAANNTRLTAPIAGVYNITGSVRWGNNTTGRRIAILSRNNTSQIARDAVSPNNTSGFGPEQDVDTLYRLEAGDFIELDVFQDSGVALNIEAFSPSSPVLAMSWVAP